MIKRDSIFISHANPQDNYFATWLAGKLALLGYKVWVDKKAIKHGNYFTLDYEKELNDNASVFLAVITQQYMQKINTPDSGVLNELTKARHFKQDIIKIPLMVQPISYGELPSGLLGVDACNFENWGKGLKDLTDSLIQKEVPKTENLKNPISFWFDSQKIINFPNQKEEIYSTNWFEIKLPNKLSVVRSEDYQNYLNVLKDSKIIFIEHGGYIVTFSTLDEIKKNIKPYDEYEFPVSLFETDTPIEIHEKLNFVEPKKTLVRLLNKTFQIFLQRQDLKKYESLNNKTNKKSHIYHYLYNDHNKKRVSLKKFGKSNRALVSKNPTLYWHFGISFNAVLIPFIGYKIRYHLIFKDVDNNYLDKDDQHELRRSVPKSWYNRKWYEMLLSIMYKISGYSNDNYIKVYYDKVNYFKMNIFPISLKSDIGYNEPILDNED